MEINEMLNTAMELFDGENKNIEKALAIFNNLAENDNVTAQFFLGEIYWNQLGGVHNDERALYWYSRAGENGHPLVQLWLGNNYYIGIRSSIDIEKAQYWYKKAALNNVPLAQYHLATIYGMCSGKEEEADYWMKRAAENHFLEAQLAVCESLKDSGDSMAYNMYVNALEQEYGGFLKKDPSVTLRFAKEYIDGRALKKDSLKAYELLSSGCLKENNAAIFYLAQCYELGWGVTQNMRMALSLYKKIARIDTRAGNKVFKIEREKTANN